MRRIEPVFTTCLAALSLAATALSAADAKKPVSFTRDVAPILAVHCQGCHHEKKAAMGFDVSSFARMARGGKQSGPEAMIVPGKPDESRLAEVIGPDAEPRMPFKLKPLHNSSIALIERWIAEGAKYDAPDPKTPLIALVDPATALKAQAALNEASPESASQETAVARAIALSPDNKRVAIDHGHEVVIYDVASAAEPKFKAGPFRGVVSALAFDAKGETLFVAHGRPGIDGFLARVDVATGKVAYDTRLHDDQILALTLAADGTSAATGSYDRTIAVLETSSGKKRVALVEHTDAVYDVAFSPADANRLASASADRSVKTWDVAAAKRIETLSDATAELYAVAFAADGKTVYAGGVDRTLWAWDLAARPPRLVRSALAHDAPITRLLMRPKSPTTAAALVSVSEDRTLRRWAPDTLKQIGASRKFEDWPTALAATADRIAVADHSGAAWLFDQPTADAKPLWIKPVRSTRAGPPDALKPELVRLADLGRPSPQFVTAGEKTVVTLAGQGAGRADRVWIEPAEVAGTLIPHDPPQPNSIKLELNVPPRQDFSTLSIRLATPLGVTGAQSVTIAPSPIVTLDARKPGDAAPLAEIRSGSLIRTVISAPGHVFRARTNVKKGVPATVRSLGRTAGSSLSERLTWKSLDGAVLASRDAVPGRETLLSCVPDADGTIILELTDQQFSGGGNHFAVLSLSDRPVANAAWPPARSRSSTAEIAWVAQGGDETTTKRPAKASSESKSESALPTIEPIDPPPGWLVDRTMSVVSVGGRVLTATAEAQTLKSGDAGVGRFESPSQVDAFRFEGKAGRRLIVETYARRLGRDADTAIEIVDAAGRPVLAARFRKVAATLVDFRDHTSRQKTIRLTRWPEFRMNDYVLIGREIARIFQLPKNPDDDCQFYGDEARWGYFGTTPEQVPQRRIVTRLERLPIGESEQVDPGILHEVVYANDDGGFTVGNDSYLSFEPPAYGVYEVRVRETRGRTGPGSAYAVVVREPKPDFSLSISPMDWNVPREGSRLVSATIRRLDGFEGPVRLRFEGLPAFLKATEGVVEAGQLTADLLVELTGDVPDTVPPQAGWKLAATATIDGKDVRKVVDGTRQFWAVTPKSNLSLTTSADRVRLVPGQVAELRLKAERGEAFKGRVPVDVRNLPYGVKVLDIGLNGVMITEKETERTIRLFAEDWVQPQSRPFFAVGRAEAAGTADSAPPVTLEIVPGPGGDVTSVSGLPR